ncbi:hypothetical protein GOBAR_DD28452 [Gossypium barbadense]|nr:hypothetical protein GOBAR_DD28452 [Gossypium barbadense]
MGICLSTTKVFGTSSNPSPDHHEEKQPASSTTTTNAKKESHKPTVKHQQQLQFKAKPSSRKQGGNVPCGKRTDFGYRKDFEKRYTTGKLLGHGQFGYTYVAIGNENGDRVAVKKIEKMKMVLPIAVEDVKREVKILEALKGHENVVQFYNAFEDDSYVYIVMELCEGGELLDRILANVTSSSNLCLPSFIRKDSRYSEKDAAVVVRQMLKVAAECHLRGLVHRDMKPENFLFKSTKEDSPLKATDFGLSDFIRPGKRFQDFVGSAYYVAPEVLKRKSGPESDVWSIGVITYILLCGKRPFWDKTEDGIFREVLKNKPDFRHKPWPTISDSAKDFVKKLLVKDPRARLTAAQALSHPWVREGGDASEIPIDISVLSNMRQFVKYSRLKQFALRALASTLNEEEIADLRDQFHAIDVDKNGVISLEEMRQVNISITPMHTGLKGSIDPLLEEADIDRDGKISLEEFRRLLRTASISVRPNPSHRTTWKL